MENELIKTKKVRQSNKLIESPYSQEFSAHEIKLFEIAVASCTKHDMEFVNKKNNKEFSYSASQVAKMLNTSVSTISHEMEKTAIRITKKAIHLRNVLEDDTVEFKIINIMPYAEYRNGIFEFHLNYLIIPYLIEINSHFTEYQLHYLLSMTSASAIKLYKLLYQYKNIKSRVFNVDELKEQFGLLKKYKQYGDFKKDVLIPSVTQINKYTDLSVSFAEIKLGKRVDKLEFTFEIKKPSLPTTTLNNSGHEIIDISPQNVNIDNLLLSIGKELKPSTKKLIYKYLKDKGVEYVETSIVYAMKKAKTNLDKYLKDTLVFDYAEVNVNEIITKKTSDAEKTIATKQIQEKKKKQQEQENLNIAMIEREWSNLSDSEKSNYVNHANCIINKHKLEAFPKAEDSLPLCVYAISNQKSYDRALEAWVKNMLRLSLNINDAIKK